MFFLMTSTLEKELFTDLLNSKRSEKFNNVSTKAPVADPVFSKI